MCLRAESEFIIHKNDNRVQCHVTEELRLRDVHHALPL